MLGRCRLRRGKMRSRCIILSLVFIAAASFSAKAEIFTANLTGVQEVPANGSTATGFARVNLNRTTGAFTLTLTYTGLGSAQTASHIHGASAIGVNSAVLFNIGAAGGTSGTITSSGTMTATDMSNLRKHLFYVNVHSTNLPGGEIRGQLGVARPVDQDGDGRTDPQVIRFPTVAPQPLSWYANSSTSGFQAFGPFGDAATDFPAPGDYDGDGKGDFALYRAATLAGGQSFFYIFQTSNNTVQFYDWGTLGDQAISRDYDGDGKTDAAVFRDGYNGTTVVPGVPGVFWIIYSSTQVRGAVTWGTTGATSNDLDTPVPADYDGDGKCDVAVYRFGALAPTNTYIIFRSSDSTAQYVPFGNFATDYILPGDYDGDGKADFALGRTGALSTSPMTWIVLRSSDGGVSGGNFGLSSDVPVQGDYDGDGKTDFAVYRQGATTGAQSFFYIYGSITNAIIYSPWGIRSDFAVNSYDSR